MELTGNAADRWEQVSNKAAELSQDIKKRKKAVSDAITSLKQVEKCFANLQTELEQLKSLTYKEVLREESNTLNDETPVFEDNPIQNDKVAADSTDDESANTDDSKEEPEQAELPLNNKE